MQAVLDRRLDLLRMEGEGFSKPEIVKDLSTKYKCSIRNVYYDFETRASWQPKLQDQQTLVQKTLNRFEYVYRQAAFKAKHSQNESIQLGALRLMSDVTARIQELIMLPELRNQMKDPKHIELSWSNENETETERKR